MAGDNTVTIIFINEDTSPVDTIRMQLEDCFGEVIHESSSSNTVSYTFEETNASKFEYIIYCIDFIYGKLQIYLNNTLIDEFYPTTVTAYDADTGEFLFYACPGTITLPVIRTFNFNINGFNVGYPLGITGITDCDITQNTSTDVSDFTLNMLSGSEYIGFYNNETY